MERIYLQALGVWVLLLILAIVNATLRNTLYGPILKNELLAHQISTGTAIVLFLTTMYVFFSRTRAPYTGTDLIIIGILWLALTIAFEFCFGHYILGNPWSRLLHDYNLFAGRLWILVLVTILVGPYVIGRYLLAPC
ncbi:MAG: hypothetical protein JW945_00820 [Methanomicrobia archaeon]|nr:hypothetical protein [Methanomicrobia archaeon]